MKAGQGILELSRVAGQTTVTRAQATNPLKFLIPRPRGTSAWAYMSNFGGGLVAGDEVSVEIRVGDNTVCFLSTQASTKVYRSPDGRPCQHFLRAVVSDGAVFVLAPDPVCCFAGAHYEQQQRFELGSGAALALVDWLTCGRRARGERWAFTRHRSRNDIFIGQEHLLCDSLLLDPADGPLDDPFRMGRFNCFALLVMVGEPLRQASDQWLADTAATPVQRQSPFICAASPIQHGALLRVACENVEQLIRFVRQKLAFVTGLLGNDPWERKW